MRTKLTPKFVEHLHATGTKRVEVWDLSFPGFGIRATASGRKTWFLMGRVGGKQQRITIGAYPGLSLAAARAQARKISAEIQTGQYAAAPKEVESVPTLGETIPMFIEMYAKPRTKGWKETQSVLQKFSPIHDRPINEIKRPDVVRVLDEIVANGTAIRANRCLAAIKKLFAWALDRGMIEVHPVFRLKPPGKEQARDRVLTDEEIALFWSETENMGYPFGPLCQLLLLTAQRRSEVSEMRWSQVDFERSIWSIPSERSKNGRGHAVPLSPEVFGVLERLPRFRGSDQVFTTNGHRGVSGFGRVKERLDATVGAADWRIHDLRRTAASGMARLGVSPHVIEKVLNHVSGTISGVAAVYNRYAYEAEKREALASWADRVRTLVQEGAETPAAVAGAIAGSLGEGRRGLVREGTRPAT